MISVWDSPVDVEFIIDSSDRVGPANFKSVMAYVQNLVRHWNIGPQKIRVGLVTYSNGVQNQFFLNSHLSQSQLIGALGNVQFQGGPSDAGNAFQFVSQTGFSTMHGARQGVPHVIIHVSNNPSSNMAFAMQEAKKAKDNGAIVYNVAIGNGVNMNEVRQLASQPASKYVLTSDTYQSLDSLVNPLSTSVRSGCLQRADLVFLVDSSSSISSEDFQQLEEFLKDVAVRLPIGPNNVQMGVLQFGSHPSIAFPLDMYSNRLDVLKGIQNLNYLGGATNTADALKYMREHVFSHVSGARFNVPRIAVVITGGHSSNPSQTTIEADNARMSKIGVIGVGVGSGVNINELHNIAGSVGRPADHNSCLWG
ncbi:cartilage matrix protein-like [Gigantopelta aegis]|uniref:cartilage matrix protein-like n=1 Tax=Gigantopelta aegis TaxID=1735272 RepID=UPI001B88BC6C|nr:cartilage matrix protein-like [Gigantopelta aegis]